MTIIWEEGRNAFTINVRAAGDASTIKYVPDTPEQWDDLLHRIAAVGGRRITGIETAPEPIKKGDRIRKEGAGVGTVKDGPWLDLGYEVWLIDFDTTGLDLAATASLTRHAPVEDPIEWVHTRDRAEIVAALTAKRIVQCANDDNGHDWRHTIFTPDNPALHIPEPMTGPYRYSGPRIDYDACQHQCLPSTSDDWCNTPDPADNLACSLPKGHDSNEHIVCAKEENGHGLLIWEAQRVVEQGDSTANEWASQLAEAAHSDNKRIEEFRGNWSDTKDTWSTMTGTEDYGDFFENIRQGISYRIVIEDPT